ncbi:MAG: Gfo/Idh/MocA family oxidoreductase [Ignavibacteria bacterium]|jgi:predicted dehydrogenase/threonine dehydrogenase-like Zn-dependent dehydrogenase|nr:Gfo/Idh/MocA family oxidoreductase [Ignavibacteria bacterium]MCU7504424.1 Gfo/Idh/MocA family oxidoreductase [Ignavibacteria bacterium]MCU7517485.1 Gfo/Idh/MocA family oxidoreductase [Ignavibacteria bacterium]
MRQIIQDLKKGDTILEEIPAPVVKANHVLIQTSCSLVSLGTEKMLVDFGKANMLDKAKQQPDKVKMVLDKIRTDGLLPTIEAVRNKLDQPLALGYSNAGRVIAVGKGISEFKPGDRVVSNGNHAEIVCVPANLVARLPDNVSDEEGSFAIVGAIGLQGVRLAAPTFGETFVVIGLGLIGLITSKILLANGCNVIGFDIDPYKIKLAESFGLRAFAAGEVHEQVNLVRSITNETGSDGVIITASSRSNSIISASAQMCRKRGRIILVGVTGLELSRADFYEKELSFQVSCSYGPGRYDESYEQKGQDYPLPYVRWSEKRNIEAVLKAISTGKLEVKSLISEVVPLDEYLKIYGNLKRQSVIASILKYPERLKPEDTLVNLREPEFPKSPGVLAIIGAGNFTGSTIIPAIRKLQVRKKYIISARGLSAKMLAKKGNFENAGSDQGQVFKDTEVNLVMITTRHNLHAKMAAEALRNGKNVFVEKPLALNENELKEILSAQKLSGRTINVGFNRRFSPYAEAVKKNLNGSPINITATMNAGFIPQNSWLHDPEEGGGRIIGEACHFIDLCSFFTGSRILQVCMNSMGTQPRPNTDNVSILLKYENGSNAVINYFSNGSKTYSKERVEIYSDERTFIIDNWRSATGYGARGFKNLKGRQDKGHKAQFRLLVERLSNGGKALIALESLINTTRASFAAIESMKCNSWVKL